MRERPRLRVAVHAADDAGAGERVELQIEVLHVGRHAYV
jgi:hypothetical protein